MNKILLKIGKYIFLLIAIISLIHILITVVRTATYITGDKQAAVHTSNRINRSANNRGIPYDRYENTFSSIEGNDTGRATSYLKPSADTVSVVFKNGNAYPAPIKGGVSLEVFINIASFGFFLFLSKATKNFQTKKKS